jgi:hypothetical protein
MIPCANRHHPHSITSRGEDKTLTNIGHCRILSIQATQVLPYFVAPQMNGSPFCPRLSFKNRLGQTSIRPMAECSSRAENLA